MEERVHVRARGGQLVDDTDLRVSTVELRDAARLVADLIMNGLSGALRCRYS